MHKCYLLSQVTSRYMCLTKRRAADSRGLRGAFCGAGLGGLSAVPSLELMDKLEQVDARHHALHNGKRVLLALRVNARLRARHERKVPAVELGAELGKRGSPTHPPARRSAGDRHPPSQYDTRT